MDGAGGLKAEGGVAVIVPARNEEANIERAVRSLAAQAGRGEILVVDDQSQDRTGEILERLKGEIAGLRVLQIESLPEGWLGKNYAVATAAKQAKGDWLLFTDADVEHRPGSLVALLERAEAEHVDLCSLSPGQETPTWWEQAVIPLVYVQLAKLYRFDEVSDPSSTAAAANGQYILIRREVYERVGGHEAVRGEILEDVALACRVKASGGRLRFLPGAEWARTRMYSSFAEMWRGWTKNLYLLYGRRPGRLLATVAEMCLLDLLPLLGAFVLIMLMVGRQRSAAVLALAAAVCVLLVGWRHALYAAQLKRLGFHQRLACLRTPGLVLVSVLLLNSARIYCLGGMVQWKGRRYSAGGG